MLKGRAIPCLLLDDGSLVKTVKFRNPNYVGDPVNVVRIYNEFEVDELLFLDIRATTQRRKPPFEIIEEIAGECFMPLAYGGGIKTLEDIERILGIGAEKVAINGFAVEDPDFIGKAASVFGSQSIVVSIDVKKHFWGGYTVQTHGGTVNTGIDAVAWARSMERQGAGELLVTSIDRDGTWSGYDLQLIRQITSAVGVPVIACGGAGRLQDIGQVIRGGASAAAMGSMVVYQRKDLGVLVNFPSRSELDEVLLHTGTAPDTPAASARRT